MAAVVYIENQIWSQSWQALYRSHLQSQVKENKEGWGEYRDDLKTFAEKAYPNLVETTKECFALTQFFSQLKKTQAAFEFMCSIYCEVFLIDYHC